MTDQKREPEGERRLGLAPRHTFIPSSIHGLTTGEPLCAVCAAPAGSQMMHQKRGTDVSPYDLSHPDHPANRRRR